MAEIGFSKCAGDSPRRSWRLLVRGDKAQIRLYLSDAEFSDLMGGKHIFVHGDDERLLDNAHSEGFHDAGD